MPASNDVPPVTQQIVPQLAYENLGAALEWLAKAFGFREREEARFVLPDGKIGHAEMDLGSGHVMLGQSAGHDIESPRSLGGTSQFLAVYVEDAAAHCERARTAGATIRAELEDKFWGDRVYEAEDLEGHRWMFCQRVRVVPPEEWPSG